MRQDRLLQASSSGDHRLNVQQLVEEYAISDKKRAPVPIAAERNTLKSEFGRGDAAEGHLIRKHVSSISLTGDDIGISFKEG
jgi:hypothetical protein